MTAEFEPIARTRLVDEIVQRLSAMILSGALEPGDPLRQESLATQLGVSRTPLREAFRILETSGLVQTSPANGAIEVVVLTSHDVRQMYEVREALDPLAAALAATATMSSATGDLVEGQLREMLDASDHFDALRYGTAHSAFHTLIYELSGNRYLQTFVPLVRLSAVSLARVHLADDGPTRTAPHGFTPQQALALGNAQHRAIYDAIRDRDQVRAAAVAREHIQSTLRGGIVEALAALFQPRQESENATSRS